MHPVSNQKLDDREGLGTRLTWTSVRLGLGTRLTWTSVRLWKHPPLFIGLQQLETRGHYYTIKQSAGNQRSKKGSIQSLFLFSIFKTASFCAIKREYFILGRSQMILLHVYSLNWLSWLTQRTLHVHKTCVYTPSSVCPIVSLSYRRYRRQSDDHLERTLPNGPSYCGHSNRTGTFGGSLSTPGYHGNREK